MNKLSVAILFLSFCCLNFAYPQNVLERKKFIPKLNNPTYLDSLFIIPNSTSVKVNNRTLDETKFEINSIGGYLILKDSSLLDSSALVEYKVLTINFLKSYFNKDIKLIMPDRTGLYNPFVFKPEELYEKENFFSDGLNKNGSISRGVSFGNNQNVVLNSGLNLQLSGKLNEKINVMAAITDDNIPFQPQGNTQQLQEFDKVFIQLNDEKNNLIAGDFVLTKPETYFMSYYKRAQGANFSTTIPLKSEKEQLTTLLAAAVSKGKFSRNIIQGIEGNQGPYKLKGAENELFITVLSGTERIFIDGQLLTRGQENDYVIDYNTAEITFTAKRYITKDRRIIAEFQYADKNYARSLIVNSTQYKKNNISLNVNYFNETDNKNRPLQQTLTDERKLILANTGDNLLGAIAPGVDSIGYRNDLVLYAKRDTIINGVYHGPIYYHSNNPDSAFYHLSFSLVGNNNGNYVQSTSVANGRVFKWVAPINGVKQGNYEPIVLLITPKQRQMLDVNYQQMIDSSFNVSAEVAISNYDQNTFSSLNDENNTDMGLKLNTEKKFKITNQGLKFFVGLQYEQLNKNFTAIERFRSVEFERDWNLLKHTQKNNQYIGGVLTGFEKKNWGRIEWLNIALEEPGEISGKQSKLNSFINTDNWNINHSASVTTNNNNLTHDRFLRQRGTISRRVSHFRLSLKIDQEQNLKYDKIKSDSLSSNSYQFSEWFVTLSNADSVGNLYAISYNQRNDWTLKNNKLTKSAFARGVGGSLELAENKNFTLKSYSTYRQLRILDSALVAQKPENNLVNRIELTLRFLRSAIYTNSFYETNTGLELRREYNFVQVAPGQGLYAWIDYNGNNIKELNEFEITPFADQAQYIKVFTPTNTYIKVYGNQFNQVINLNPSAIIKSKSFWAEALNYWSNQFAYRIDRKTTSTQWKDQYNPFYRNTNDVFLQTLNSSFRNTLFFNKTGYVFGADYTYQEINGKALLVNGYETRTNYSHIVRSRLSLNRFFILNTEAITGNKTNQSQLLTNRNYDLKINELEPKITYQLGSEFRWSLAYRYTLKQNNFRLDTAKGIQQKLTTEIRYNKANKGSWNGQVNFIKINFVGKANSPVGYEILEGLRPGINFTWSLGYQQNLTSNLQLTINYEGRKPEGLKTIHTGNVTIRAIF